MDLGTHRRQDPRVGVTTNCAIARGAGAVAGAVGTEPSNRAGGVAAERPPVFMGEAVVERADQHQVVQVRAAAAAPPHDVVGLRERPCSASREPAPAIAVTDLAHHPRRGLPGHAAETEHVPISILEHGLDPGGAQEPLDALGLDHRPALDLAGPGGRHQSVQLRVHDHGRPIRIGVGRDAGRADRDEGVGSPRGGETGLLLLGHLRDLFCHALDRTHDDRSLRGRELCFQADPAPFVEPPPRQGAGPLSLDDLLGGSPGGEVASVADGGARDLLGPPDEVALGLGCGEAGQLHDLVDAQPAPREGVGEPRETVECVRGPDPAAGLPLGDAVAHGEPMGQIARTCVAPGFVPVEPSDQGQEVTLGAGDLGMRVIEGIDETALDRSSRRVHVQSSN